MWPRSCLTSRRQTRAVCEECTDPAEYRSEWCSPHGLQRRIRYKRLPLCCLLPPVVQHMPCSTCVHTECTWLVPQGAGRGGAVDMRTEAAKRSSLTVNVNVTTRSMPRPSLSDRHHACKSDGGHSQVQGMVGWLPWRRSYSNKSDGGHSQVQGMIGWLPWRWSDSKGTCTMFPLSYPTPTRATPLLATQHKTKHKHMGTRRPTHRQTRRRIPTDSREDSRQSSLAFCSTCTALCPTCKACDARREGKHGEWKAAPAHHTCSCYKKINVSEPELPYPYLCQCLRLCFRLFKKPA